MSRGQPNNKTLLTVLIIVGMLITGTSNTLLNKWQDMICVKNCDEADDKKVHYGQPVWQTYTMFLGEFLCMIVYYLASFVSSVMKSNASNQPFLTTDDAEEPLLKNGKNASSKSASDDVIEVIEDPEGVPSPRKELTGWSLMLMWIPAICDIIGTTLMNIGLLAVAASVYQMLRGAVVIFTGILSYFILKARHPLERVLALGLVMLGVAVVGVAPILYPDNAEESKTLPFSPAIGVLLVLIAQCFSALQFVAEEKIVMNYTASPMRLVGLEGFWGLFTITILMPIFHFSFGQGTGNYFDLVEGWRQFVHDPVIYGTAAASAVSIGMFNYFGLNITRYISATSRTTIDTCRTLFIWIISLCVGWETLIWLQIIGFAVLIYGTFVFNQLIPLVPCRRRSE